MRNTHGARLERWLGAEQVALLSQQTRGWHGRPIPIGNVPGIVYACGDGDFVGAIKGGHYAGLADYAADRMRANARRVERSTRAVCGMFSSLGDIISEATSGGKRQDFYFYKGPSTAAATNQTLWNTGDVPGAGANASSRPSGSTFDRTITPGGIGQNNAAGGDSLHLVSASAWCSQVTQTLLLYDKTFGASSILHTTTGNQSITGVPLRYTSTDANGCFITLEVSGTLGTTAHTATITYTDQDGNAAEAGSAQSVTVSSVANRLPLPQWFYRLNDGDTGARTVTNIAFSAVSSGNSRLLQGKALLYMPIPGASGIGAIFFDGINSVPGLPRIVDDACVTFLALQAGTNATTYQGQLVMVSG